MAYYHFIIIRGGKSDLLRIPHTSFWLRTDRGDKVRTACRARKVITMIELALTIVLASIASAVFCAICSSFEHLDIQDAS